MITDNDAGYESYQRKADNADPAQATRELYSRYASLLAPIRIPDITVVDVKRLSTALGDGHLSRGTRPRDHLIDSIHRHLDGLAMRVSIAPAVVTEQDRRDPVDDVSEIASFEALRAKVDGWSPIQCMKIIEALECLQARDRLPIEITPAMVHAALRIELGRPRARKAQQSKPKQPATFGDRLRGLLER